MVCVTEIAEQNFFALSHIQIHKYKVTDASAHDKQMKDFMGTEVLMPVIENRQLQRIDHTADGVDDTASQKPEESTVR